MAMRNASVDTRRRVHEILPAWILQDSDSMQTAASWPDVIKQQQQYSWSEVLHYINPANEYPPFECLYENDLLIYSNELNISTALLNYTTRIVQAEEQRISLDSKEGSEGDPAVIFGVIYEQPISDRVSDLLFLVHYVGDIHQPLHTTGREEGGNHIKVTFGDSLTDLHTLWDSLMLEVALN
jgi:hypothetical protein